MTIQSRHVEFESDGARLCGTLFHREGRGDESRPGVIITGAWTTVKEQMPTVYARALAEHGYAALVFDFRGWGASEGGPRYMEDPVAKTADIQSAADFMGTLDEVDADHLSGVGICASSGYMADAVASHDKLGKLVMIAAWLHDPEMAKGIYGGDDAVATLIAKGRAAAAGEEPAIITAASATDDTSLMYQAPYYTEEDRGLISAYDNKFNLASWEPWLTYDAQTIADRLAKPALIICSEAAALPAGAHAFAKRTKEPVEELWLDDVSQFDFYDRPDVVARAADATADFLQDK